MQLKLKEKFQDHITFTNLPGRPNLVCFRDMGAYILYKEKRKTEQTKESIITAAAKLIKAELSKVYPTFDELSSIEDQREWIPESLQLLLSYLIPSELKQVLLLKRDFADKNLALKKITEENL